MFSVQSGMQMLSILALQTISHSKKAFCLSACIIMMLVANFFGRLSIKSGFVLGLVLAGLIHGVMRAKGADFS